MHAVAGLPSCAQAVKEAHALRITSLELYSLASTIGEGMYIYIHIHTYIYIYTSTHICTTPQTHVLTSVTTAVCHHKLMHKFARAPPCAQAVSSGRRFCAVHYIPCNLCRSLYKKVDACTHMHTSLSLFLSLSLALSLCI
jgi:hypothetical protein